MRTVLIPIIIAATGLFALHADAKTASEVFDLASASVVVVYGYDASGNRQSQGSGIVLPAGKVATNCHVVKESIALRVKYQQTEYAANISHADLERDVCILSAARLKARAAKLGNTRSLKVGARVYAIGAPKGLSLSISEGIISGLRGSENGHYVQTTAAISPGSSGGGLFDEEGRLIGLPTFYLEGGQQLNFAVPVDWVKQLLQQKAGNKPLPVELTLESRTYAAALDLFREGAMQNTLREDYIKGSILLFHQFLEDFPESALAPNARYWIGFSHYLLKDYLTSLTHQEMVVKSHPFSDKVPDALLNISTNLIAMHQIDDARKTLEELVTKHPGTNAANLAIYRLTTLK